jgi:hypothetical protein
MTKVAIFTPVWKRPKMREAFMDHMVHHVNEAPKYGIDLSVNIAGSEGAETMNEATSRGFNYVECDNLPLGRKFNKAMLLAMLTHDPDYLMVVGSDTFMLPTIWGKYKEGIALGCKYMGVKDLFMWDWRDNTAVYWGGYTGRRAGEPIGPGRLMHKSIIPEDGRLYNELKSRNLDSSATARLPRAVTFEARDYLLTSCKGDENITEVSAFNQDELEAVDHKILKEAFGL